ncbi:Vitamin B12 import ATP-binding protein BtuD [Streptomyces alboniger]
MKDQKGLGRYQAAAVDVTLKADSRENVLVVPVNALVAQRGGGYAVEVVTADGTEYRPVKLGMFADGKVEVSGTGIKEGTRRGGPQVTSRISGARTRPVVELAGVSKTYGDVAALHGADLLIRRGELLAIVGPSGSGKSTMLNIMGTLDRPSAGSVHIDGHDVSALSDRELSALRPAPSASSSSSSTWPSASPRWTAWPTGCCTAAARAVNGAASPASDRDGAERRRAGSDRAGRRPERRRGRCRCRAASSRPLRSPMTSGSPASAAMVAPPPTARTNGGTVSPSAGRARTPVPDVPRNQASSSASRAAKSSASCLSRPSALRTPSVNPTERPSPMSIRPGKSDSRTPNCSATTSDWWLGSITPPVPTRMVRVAAATAAARTVGAKRRPPAHRGAR